MPGNTQDRTTASQGSFIYQISATPKETLGVFGGRSSLYGPNESTPLALYAPESLLSEVFDLVPHYHTADNARSGIATPTHTLPRHVNGNPKGEIARG